MLGWPGEEIQLWGWNWPIIVQDGGQGWGYWKDYVRFGHLNSPGPVYRHWLGEWLRAPGSVRIGVGTDGCVYSSALAPGFPSYWLGLLVPHSEIPFCRHSDG